MNAAWDRFGEILQSANSFIVCSHVCPDGDAVGSSLAMGLVLEGLGKSVVVFNRDEIPYNFGFLPGRHLWRRSLDGVPTPDVTILLDCGEPSRIGEEYPAHGWGAEVVVIDHHKTFDPDFATLYLRDVDAAAAGELVWEVVDRFGTLTPEIAKNLYCCLTTDTGGFRYSSTSPRTFRIAAQLLDSGVDAWEVAAAIYESQPLERVRLLCHVLETLRLSDDGRLAFLRVEQSMLEATGASAEMIDGFINYARSVRGVEVATQLKQLGPEQWSVSFRSRGLVDVSQLAAKFGGGGHHNAAGCQMTGPPVALEKQLCNALLELLDA